MAKNLDLNLGDAPARPAKKLPVRESANTQKREAAAMVDLNFKVSVEFRREFKLWAAAHDMSQKETLERAFRLLKQQGG